MLDLDYGDLELEKNNENISIISKKKMKKRKEDQTK